MIGRRTTVLILMSAALVSWAGLQAQEPGPARRSDPSRRVPRHFSKVGLTDPQRQEIYRIRAKHQEKITALRKQIEEAQAKELAECEGVLTDFQKKALRDMREATKKGPSGTPESGKVVGKEATK